MRLSPGPRGGGVAALDPSQKQSGHPELNQAGDSASQPAVLPHHGGPSLRPFLGVIRPQPPPFPVSPRVLSQVFY